MLDKEYKFYKTHKTQLDGEYANRYIVVVGDAVLGGFDSLEKALEFAAGNGNKPGEFLLQYCDPEADQTQHFRTRARFSASA